MTSNQTAYRVRADLVVERIEDQALVLDMSRNVYFSLKPMAVVMFESLKRGQTFAQVCEDVMAQYDVSPEIVASDLADFVDALMARELVDVLEGEA